MPYYPPDGAGTVIIGAATTPIHGTVTVVPGTPNVLVMATPSSPVTDYKHGGIYIIHPNADVPSGLTTLNISGVGAIEVVKNDTTNPATGDIPADREFALIYNADEPQFQSIALTRSEIAVLGNNIGNTDLTIIPASTARVLTMNGGSLALTENANSPRIILRVQNLNAIGDGLLEFRSGVNVMLVGIDESALAMKFGPQASNFMVLTLSGFWGLGKEPTTSMDVQVTRNDAGPSFLMTNVGSGDLTHSMIDDSVAWTWGHRVSDGSWVLANTTVVNAAALAIVVNTNENVGIKGEPDSSAALKVNGDLKVTGNIIANNIGTKTITIENPTASENIGMFRTDIAITVLEVIAVLVGSSTPTVTYQLKHHTSRNNAGNNLTTSGAVTSVTTGDTATLSDATIPANSWVWLISTAQGGTVGEMTINVRFIAD